MVDKFCIAVCNSYARELKVVSDAWDFHDVVTTSFPATCGIPPFTWDDWDQVARACKDCHRVEILGQCCLTGLENPPASMAHYNINKLVQCFYMLADRNVVDNFIKEKAYLVIPGWLATWRSRMDQWGFDQRIAQEFFAEFAGRVVLLDTGIYPKSTDTLREFTNFINLPFEIYPVGLDHFRLFLSKHILEWRLETVGQDMEAKTDSSHKEIADYAMALDLLNSMVTMTTENDVVKKILELFSMLFAPEVLLYIPVEDGIPGEIEGHFSQQSFDNAAVEKRLMDLRETYAWTESENGFQVRISYGDEIVGQLEVDHLAFPNYRDHYLNLALAVVSVCGLAIENARKYQKIVAAESKIRASHERLEAQKVELEIAKEAAEAANRAKSQFLTVVNHELRTPLNSILGYAHNLNRNQNLSPKQVESLAIIQKSGDHLQTLINDILNYSMIETGQITLFPSEMHLESFLNTVIGIIRTRADQKDIRLIYEPTTDLPLGIEVDEKRLRQVLLNLLDNAVKFTEVGQVSLSIGMLDGKGKKTNKKSATSIRFEVQDTGIGISPDKFEALFQPFTQLSHLSIAKGGIGLGLAISYNLVKLMGSELQVESQPDLGSTFWFDLELPMIWSGYWGEAVTPTEPATAAEAPQPAYETPPQEVLQELHALVSRGNFTALRQRSAHIQTMDESYLPFLHQLNTLIENYQERAILSLIESFFDEEQNDE